MTDTDTTRGSFAGTLAASDIEADGSLTGRRARAEGPSPDGSTIGGPATGRVLTIPAPAPRAGRP